MEGINGRKNISKINEYIEKKMAEKNARKFFLESHVCREQKNGVKKTRENFF